MLGKAVKTTTLASAGARTISAMAPKASPFMLRSINTIAGRCWPARMTASSVEAPFGHHLEVAVLLEDPGQAIDHQRMIINQCDSNGLHLAVLPASDSRLEIIGELLFPEGARHLVSESLDQVTDWQ